MTKPDPGAGKRLLYPTEIIRSDDEWTITTYIGWGRARGSDVGLSLSEARHHAPWRNDMYYRRAMQQVTRCGCGKHDVNAHPNQYDFGAHLLKTHNGKPILPGEWDTRCIPYGADNDETIGDILAQTP